MTLGRRRGRILAFQAICACGSGASVEDVLTFEWFFENSQKTLSPEAFIFPKLLVLGTLENLAQIDTCIEKHLERWAFSRLNCVDKAVLRLSTYSLLFQKDIPAAVIINEAISIANDYGTDDSYKFVNAVLDSIKNSE